MGQPAARISDMHVCPMVTAVVPHVGGPIILGSMTVMTGGLPQARVSDMLICVGPPDVIALGSFTVLVNGMPAARMGDLTAHGGVIVLGDFTVLIG
ncbi:MAG TPA: PAAR domain-containing protein [Caulobacteraceae bacterium]